MIDWDDAFDNTGHVPGAADLPALWERRAAAYRDEMQAAGRLRADLAYGPGPRARLDLAAPSGSAKGLVVIVHGGYWRRFDKSCWTHLARGCVEAGWSVALPSYPLAPEARISEITAAIACAIAFAAGEVAGPVRLAGHSAGGHLVARMICAGVMPETLTRRLARVVSISGVHDLRPLLETEMNAVLRLSPEEAAAESPALCDPLPDIPFTGWVGAQERPEFLRQTRLIEEAWARRGAAVSATYDPGHHHFSVIEALARPDSALTQEVLR